VHAAHRVEEVRTRLALEGREALAGLDDDEAERSRDRWLWDAARGNRLEGLEPREPAAELARRLRVRLHMIGETPSHV
jgi:hypothetical protein